MKARHIQEVSGVARRLGLIKAADLGGDAALFRWVWLYYDFDGRASRAEYWLGVSGWAFLEAAAIVIDAIADPGVYVLGDPPVGVAFVAVMLFSILPLLALQARRMHDIGKSAWSLLWQLLPIFGDFILLYWMLVPGQPKANRYGSAPPETPRLPKTQPAYPLGA